MDRSELAKLMLEWENLYQKISHLESVIKEVVLESGETQRAGNVIARYSGGRKRYDYQTAAVGVAPVHIIEEHTVPKVDWRSVCKEAGITDIPFTQGSPSVKLSTKDG